MTDLLRSTTLAVRTDPLNAPTPQTVAPWPEVLVFLHHLEALAGAGTAFQLVETPGQVAWVVAEAPAFPAKAEKAAKTPRQKAAKG